MIKNVSSTFKSWITINYHWILIVSCIPLFSTKALFNLPLVIMAIMGARSLVRNPGVVCTDRNIRIMVVLFLCLWVPLLLSLLDAVNFGRSSATVARYMALFFVGIFIVQACRSELVRRRIYYSIVILVSLMLVDGLLQYIVGFNLLGNPMSAGRVTSIFYPKLHLGLLLAVLSPVIFNFTFEYFKKNKLILLLPVLLMVILALAGNRVSWMMFSLATLVFVVYIYRNSNTHFKWSYMFGFTIFLAFVLMFAYQSPFVKVRVDETVKILSTDFDTVNRATSYRLSIWLVGKEVYKENWINGIGPRGFRYVYEKYADKDNFFLNPKLKDKGMTHPHLMVLEVAAETGTIGLIGYLLFFVFLIRFYRRSEKSARTLMFPLMLATIVAVFPLNAHMAWYGSYWGAVSWWLLTLALGFARRQGNS